MTPLLMLLLVVLVVALGYFIAKSSAPNLPLDPETEMKTAIRLHEIRRKLDVADLKHRQRQDANRLRREIADAIREGDG